MFWWRLFSVVLVHSLFLLFIFHPTSSLSTTPVDQVVVVNSSAVFQCGSNNSVIWSFRRTGQLGDKRVYVGGQLSNPRYSLNRSTDDWYGLVISDVQLSDSGLYTCIDNDGFGPPASARLVVLDSLPRCGANVSVNQPAYESQIIELRCVFVYAGDPPPRVRWTGPRISVHNSSMVSTKLTDAVRLESWIVIRAAADGVRSYRYSITTFADDDEDDATASTTTPMYIWNSSSFVVLYAVRNIIINMSHDGNVVVRGETLQCHADGCPPARYQWKNVGTGRKFVGPSLRLDVEGQHNYECTATNVVANVTYSARAQISLLVTGPPTVTTENSAMKLTGSLTTAVVIATVTTAVIAALVVCCVCLVHRLFVARRRRRERVTLTSSLSSTDSAAAMLHQQVRVWTPPQAAAAEFRDKRDAVSMSCLYDSIDEQDVGYEQLPGGRLSAHHQRASTLPAASLHVRPPGHLCCDAVDGNDTIGGSPHRTLTENDYLYICDGATGQHVCCLQEETNDTVRYIQPLQPSPPRDDDGFYVNDRPATTPAGSTTPLSDDHGVYIHTLTDD